MENRPTKQKRIILSTKRKQRYLTRHRRRESWNNYMSAGALSRYILWGEPTLRESIKKYKEKFNLQ